MSQQSQQKVLGIESGWRNLCDEWRNAYQERLEKQFALFDPPAISPEKMADYEKALLCTQDIEQRMKEYRHHHNF